MSQRGEVAFVIGDSYVINSGLSYVAKNLKRILVGMGYKVIYISVSNSAYEPMENESYYIGNSPDQKGTPVDKFDSLVEKFRPTLVVSCHDLWMLMTPYLSGYRETFTWVQYNPVEANYYPQRVVYHRPDHPQDKLSPIPIAEIGKSADYVIAYNWFGRDGLTSMGIQTDAMIHNGYSKSRIYKLEDKELIKKRRASMGVDDNTIMFLSMGRNSTRKRQDVLLESWFKFLQLIKKNNTNIKARIHIHSDQNSFNGFDIPSICKRLGVENTVSMPPHLNYSDQDLNLLYNCADVYVGLPGGEGHGYGFLESMVLGKPLVYGSFGGQITYCENAGIKVPAVQFISSQNIDAPRAVISSTKAAEAMYALATDKNLRDKYGQAGMKDSKELEWSKIDKQFEEHFEKAVTKGKRMNIFAKRLV